MPQEVVTGTAVDGDGEERSDEAIQIDLLGRSTLDGFAFGSP